MTSKKLIGLFITLVLTGCIGAGTLGGFDLRTFPVSKKRLVNAIDTFYSRHPEYKIPNKWKTFDDWHERGYDFLDSRIFYFNTPPEEIYYVSFYGDANDSTQVDSTQTGLSIRAYRNDKFGWTKEDDCSSKEKRRVQKRFDQEIILKLEEYTKTKSAKE